MRYLLPLLAFVMIAATSCNKHKGWERAWIINTKDVTYEGCGWVLRLDNGNDEVPEYVPSSFTHDSLRVWVKYHDAGRYDTCGYASQPKVYNIVVIDEIERE
jgi:hypothetical protein